ncbi:MAG: acetamidase/formamidase family protein [Candidatus Bathycorpusculaceae bacterium]
MKKVSKSKAVYSFSPKHSPAEYVAPGEKVLLELEDAFGGQVKDESAPVEKLDWSRVNGATGPIFIENAKPGDTLIVNVEDIKVADRGVIAVIPMQGALGNKVSKASLSIVPIYGEHVHFGREVRVKASPMIGTIGVAPLFDDVPTGSLGKHGGNMDVKEVVAGSKLYFPVFVEGALFAAGDLHAVQGDGEVCVSAVEVSGEVLLSFEILKGKCPQWPVLETKNSYAFLACGYTLDEASFFAVDAVVEALMREYKWSFEKAYMFASLVVDLRVNQVVDPKKGVRAVIPKEFVSLESLFSVGL